MNILDKEIKEAAQLMEVAYNSFGQRDVCVAEVAKHTPLTKESLLGMWHAVNAYVDKNT